MSPTGKVRVISCITLCKMNIKISSPGNGHKWSRYGIFVSERSPT